MRRTLVIQEENGIYRAENGDGNVQHARSAEDLMLRLDPGLGQPNAAMAGGIIEHALGARRGESTGIVRQGLVGT